MTWPTPEQSKANARVGAWATRCCTHDAHELKTEEDVRQIIEDIDTEDIEAMRPKVWPTREALEADASI